MSRLSLVAMIVLFGALIFLALLQAWTAAAQATAMLGAQLLACLLGALIPLAFLAGLRLGSAGVSGNCNPLSPSRLRVLLPGRRDAFRADPRWSAGGIPEILEVIREWWA